MGVWGPRTASIDWCEDNYTVTVWIAEFWNTVSNLAMIIPPIYALLTSATQLERRYVLSYLMLLLVGIGSWMFHMTLRYSMQLLDELPMIFATCVFIYTLAQIKEDPGKQNWKLAGLLVFYSVTFVAIYMVETNPLIHEFMYGFLVVILILQSGYLACTLQDPMRSKLLVVGMVMYAMGFLLWNIDNHFCSHLQNFRARNSPSIGVFSQLHAWWHLLAGYSTYIQILFSTHYRLSVLKRDPQVVGCPIGITVVKA